MSKEQLGAVVGGTAGALAASIAGAKLGALGGTALLPGPGTAGGAILGALGGIAAYYAGAETGAAIGRRFDESGASETASAEAVSTPVRQHVGDVHINVQPLPGEDPETYARRVAELARDYDLQDLDLALVDGVS